MKINVQGSKHRDAFAIPPEKLYIRGLDKHPHTGKMEEPSPYMRVRLKRPISDAFVANLKTYGVLQPIVVEQIDKETFSVVAGSRRTRGLRQANKELEKEGKHPLLVLCVIRTDMVDGEYDPDNNPAQSRIGVMISENENREEVEAEAKVEEAWTLINVNHFPPEDVAVMMGVTTQTLKMWLKDKSFGAEIKAELAAKTMDKTTARALAAMPKEKQEKVLAEAKKTAAAKKGTRNGHMSVRDVLKAAEKVSTGFTAPTKPEVLERMALLDIPPAAFEVLLWISAQGPLPTFLQTPREIEEARAAAAERARQQSELPNYEDARASAVA